MKNLNDRKDYRSSKKQTNTDKESNPEISNMSTVELLKDSFRLNSTGVDDDLSVDIQDALRREMSLSLVVENIFVTVEGEIVNLEGEVYREEEKMTAGDIAKAFAGDDNVNNSLSVMHDGN